MSIHKQNIFSKENFIKFLKRRYMSGTKFYRWYTLTITKRCADGTVEHHYLAVGPKVVQSIINGFRYEEISIDDYNLYIHGRCYVECNVYKQSWTEVQNHRRKRHEFNCELCKHVHSKDRRKKIRKEAREFESSLHKYKDL